MSDSSGPRHVPAPERLRALAAVHLTRRVEQPLVAYEPERWLQRGPNHAEVFRDLPRQLDRDALRALAEAQPWDEAGALRIFIASQVWGYGAVGYGPFRLAEALAYPSIASVLHAVRHVLEDRRPVDAFRLLCIQHRVPWVGTAFGSKYLHFADPRRQALILDSVVAGWLNAHLDLAVRCLRDEREYQLWLRLAHAWASDLRLTADTVELLVFTDGLRATSQWRPAEGD